MTDSKLVPVEQIKPMAWVTADTVLGQTLNGKPRRIWWENHEGVGMPIYDAPQPAPEVSALVEALKMMVELAEFGGFGRDDAMDAARAALATFQKRG